MSVEPNEFELSDIDVWPADALAKLSQFWITSADQLVALAAVDGGVTTIARATGLAPERVRKLVDQTRTFLSARHLGELETPVDTSRYGLGAEEPEPPGNDRKKVPRNE